MPDTIVVTTQDLEPAVRLRDALVGSGYDVELLTATERLSNVEHPSLLVLTGELEEKRSRRLALEAAERGRVPVIGLADSPEQHREAARGRAFAEIFLKPIDADEVATVARRIVERRRLQDLTGIVGETDAIREALERVVQIAPVNSTVLVLGESGTGKELVARGIHALSPRRHRPFIAANVAALPETLLESELFGHEKGAFTGAVAQRKGLFELAHRGTLFLDEIGEMPLTTQSKLLRVLEEREFMRVGGEEPISVDVRVIAATNQDLRRDVQFERFRRDLYYRLSGLQIQLPALRDRREDIPLLIERFVREASRTHDRPPISLAPEALDILLRYDWPGNVRELRNLVESMVILSPGTLIRAEDIPPTVRSPQPRSALPMAIAGDARSREQRDTGLEFIFHTLIQLRMDIEDLRREFEDYRRTHPELAGAPLSLPQPYVRPPVITDALLAGEEEDLEEEEEPGVVVYRPGMRMEDVEREAITAVLREVKGNRREAAARLGIGERTLYRKIKEYGIPL